MFHCCKSLISLPDITKWDFSQVESMGGYGLFHYCKSLESLPDISRWDTSKVKNMNGIFSECS